MDPHQNFQQRELAMAVRGPQPPTPFEAIKGSAEEGYRTGMGVPQQIADPTHHANVLMNMANSLGGMF